MNSLRQQQTIAQVAEVQGFGYWSGEDVRVELRPAAEGTGLVFVRRDLDSCPRIPALVAQRVETPLRTTLVSDGAAVEMVEHVLAACAGLRIDNCEIWVDQPELPGMDGSSRAFVDALLSAGVTTQEAPRPQLIVTEPTRVGDDECWIEARPAKRGGFRAKYRLDYGLGNVIGRETLELQVDEKSFCEELASARTFLLQSEAEWLRSRGLGQRVTTQDVLVFGDEGPIDNERRFEDECVRHKILDLVGDLALAGCDIVGSFIAQRSGHRQNAELVRALLAEGQIIEDRRRTA
ncbi:MAG: UDP-3-O-[3-hydroxymyristoyl] N-acetylglucosamine deacetylase [Planctomycetaceae bacterium]|nr:UDP-3-O-[3-hydroxymyristoyl] N-acetylglucosamine deacetylase [Planctomycetaceae bacterium]